MSIPADDSTGYTYDVDFCIAPELHDYFYDLPPAHEKTFIENEKLSKYRHDIVNGKPRPKTEKLILTLFDKHWLCNSLPVVTTIRKTRSTNYAN